MKTRFIIPIIAVATITISAAITFVSVYFSPYLPSMGPLLGGS